MSPLDPRHDLLLQRGERAFGPRPVSQAVARVRAIIGTKFPDGEELANHAMETLKTGKVPPLQERMALERMIKIMRPAILSRKGALGDLPQYGEYPAGLAEQWDRFRQTVVPFLYSVGRIDEVPDKPVGTCFLVSPNVVVTNRHVVEKLSCGTNELEEGQAVVRFKQEYGSPDYDSPQPVTAVLGVHPDIDLAVVQIRDEVSRPPLPIGAPTVDAGLRVAVLGYPAQDDRNPLFMDVIYEGRYDVKRAAPGEITGIGSASIYHDCSTLGGNSGSPVLSMETCRVIGVHRDGPLFLYRNEAIDARHLAEFVQPYLS